MMKKKELIEKLSQKGYTKKDAEVILNDMTSVLMEALVAGESVMLHGFGTFSIQERKARISLHPHTGEPLEVPACKSPKFTAGKLLKRAVKEGFLRPD